MGEQELGISMGTEIMLFDTFSLKPRKKHIFWAFLLQQLTMKAAKRCKKSHEKIR